MVNYKLMYFPVRNLGECPRLIFHYANVPFEDFKIPFDEWPTTYKNKTPYGKIPVLEVDGKPLCESTTIIRYLAKRYKLAGKTRWEKAKVDELLELHKSEYNEILEADYLHSLHEMAPSLFEGHLDLVGFVKRVYLSPRLRKYIEERPVTAL
ncbi:hypothetical protein M3Y99_01635100 [Aphelenchoides fujianensis]|nr:hypothetical protein M3Y99_01635100 [Aphelenchoides fujianensis]